MKYLMMIVAVFSLCNSSFANAEDIHINPPDIEIFIGEPDPSPAGSPEDVKCCENEGSSSGGSSGGSSSSKGDQKKESLIDEIKSNLVEEMAKQGFLYAAKKAKSLVIRPVTLAGAVISAFTPTTMGDAELKPEKSAELDPKKPEVNVGFPRVKDPKDLKRPDNSGSSYIGKPNSVRSIGVKK